MMGFKKRRTKTRQSNRYKSKEQSFRPASNPLVSRHPWKAEIFMTIKKTSNTNCRHVLQLLLFCRVRDSIKSRILPAISRFRTVRISG